MVPGGSTEVCRAHCVSIRWEYVISNDERNVFLVQSPLWWHHKGVSLCLKAVPLCACLLIFPDRLLLYFHRPSTLGFLPFFTWFVMKERFKNCIVVHYFVCKCGVKSSYSEQATTRGWLTRAHSLLLPCECRSLGWAANALTCWPISLAHNGAFHLFRNKGSVHIETTKTVISTSLY